jgi:putative (di)nucleoside polyphosphate hydrolase
MTTIVDPAKLDYRPCVGVMLLSGQGKVWIGRRSDKPNEEGTGHWWQMPQGGIDKRENPRDAALRELKEETGIRSASFLAEAPGWFYYDLPTHLIGRAWGGKYRGQKQRWIALRFEGDDGEVDIAPRDHKAEFDAWRWASMDELLDLIVPFKREVYGKVVAAFRHLGK